MKGQRTAHSAWAAWIATAVVAAALGASLLWSGTCQAPPSGPAAGPPPAPEPDAARFAPAAEARPADRGASSGVEAVRRPLTPEALLRRLRQAVDSRPEEALRLARLGERLHPAGGPLAEERSLLKMRALVHLNQIAQARDEAVRFFRRHPGSALGPQVSQLTGVHPRPPPGPSPGP